MSGVPGEVARTAVSRASTARLAGPGGARFTVLDHAEGPQGALELVVVDHDPGTGRPGPATAVVTDVSPVPAPDRVRAVVRLGGRPEIAEEDDEDAAASLAEWARARTVRGITPTELLRGVRLVRLRPVAVRLATSCGCFAPTTSPGQEVDLTHYRAATPDPLAPAEHEWLGHLVATHGTQLHALCRLATPASLPTGRALRPHAVDRHGLVFRAAADPGAGCRDLRLSFDRPVDCLCAATDALGRLTRRALEHDEADSER